MHKNIDKNMYKRINLSIKICINRWFYKFPLFLPLMDTCSFPITAQDFPKNNNPYLLYC